MGIIYGFTDYGNDLDPSPIFYCIVEIQHERKTSPYHTGNRYIWLNDNNSLTSQRL
jgi:hypothetical protein